MGLSRLDNFLKSSRGTILYVDPSSLDATDSIENRGNSLTRPFKTIQRALIESARFSYQRGLDNDRFGKTTILLYPGEHVVDNRPGFIPDGANNFRLRNGSTSNDLPPFDLTSNFDLSTADNELYKLNSIHGGVILPRGTSLVGLDLRKTKIRPKYVPDPQNDNIERSAIFRVTGACYLWQFSIFDGDPNGNVYKDYNQSVFVPNFSHHKLTVFEYADGVNGVNINDTFQTYTSSRTDLDMYYEKVGLVYGQSSGRPIEPDYPSTGLDIQPKIDEYRIVGSTGEEVGISSIKAGDGVTPTATITVTTDTAVSGLDVDTPFRITGITASGYSGQFVVSEKVDSTNIKYTVQNAPSVALPTVTGSKLTLSSDTVTSASPYIFNISLRSVFGMCGMLADGNKATGFRSMVVAQYTGIGLQKDDNAFVKYNDNTPPTGQYDDNTVAGNETISTSSKARYKPSYRNFHVKVTNNSFIQAVSIFAIGFSEHFVTENGGDISLTNSNSNFGANALTSVGFRTDAFSQDDVGYITHILPPKEVPLTESSIEFDAIDVLKTDSAVGVGSTGNLYLLSKTNVDLPPENVIEGFRFGARTNDQLNVLITQSGVTTEYSARIVMPDNTAAPTKSSEKSYTVRRSVAGINSIGSFSDGGTANVITLTEAHRFLNGESVRVIGETGQIPDGLESNTVYFAITSGLTTNTNLKLAKTLNDAINGEAITINEKGGVLNVVSRVSDKNAGDLGHPIQFDGTNGQWYVKVSTAATENAIYPTIVGLGTTSLGNATSRTFIKRRSDTRSALDKTYRMRYVIPANAGGKVGRPPTEGFIIQESNTSIGATDGEIQTYFGSGSLSNINQQRNFRFIAGANFSESTANIDTELPHDLKVGASVEIQNIISTGNTTGVGNSGYNGQFVVTGISSTKQFSVGMSTDPGTFDTNVSQRTTSLPFFKRKKYAETFYTYRLSEAQRYVSGEQDGIYYLSVLNASVSPTVAPFTGEKFSQPVKELFPKVSRDNVVSDPDATKCFAKSELIGIVDVNDRKNSVTRQAAEQLRIDNATGIGITDIFSSTGTAHTIHTDYDHGLNRLSKVQVNSVGAGYSDGTYYNVRLVSIGTSETGQHATAKVVIASNVIDSVTIMDGGSAYGIGNTLSVTGITTTGSGTHTEGVVEVTKIYDNVGDVIKVIGVSSATYKPYNQLYRITDVGIGITATKTVTVAAASSLSSSVITSETLGVGSTLTTGAYFYLAGESKSVSAFDYTIAGVATVTTVGTHGLNVDNKVTITGAAQTQYNGSFVVTKVNSLTQFEANLGVGTLAPTASGTIFALPEGLTAHDGNVTIEDENLAGRMIPTYAGITTTVSSAIANASTDQVYITNIGDLDILIGDYLQVGGELMRVKTTVTGSNPIRVFRGVLGSKATPHALNSAIKRVRVEPIELRRHSIIRASGHTFEYVGFGPGNYSTAFPDKHDRAISKDEELLAQSNKREGGINFYTGMNDKGISYSGNKKLSTITGREEIFDTPVRTITGEDILSEPAINVITPVEGSFSRSIKVEGGPDNKTISEFNGPIIVNNKLTINSDDGVEANSLFLQGDATVSRNYTVGISAPVLAGNPGNVIWKANPSQGGTWGYVYTTDNAWRAMGLISLERDSSVFIFDKVGVGTTTPGLNTLQVGSGTSLFAVDGDGVGIGTTANGSALRVVGDANISGVITATRFEGDGSQLNNVNVAAAGWTNITGGTPILYNTDLNEVGIGTSVATGAKATIGAVGASGTSLLVNGEARFAGIITANNVTVTGFTTITGDYAIENTGGEIVAGKVTTTDLIVGTALTTSSNKIGIGTTAPRTLLDVQGVLRTTALSENVDASDIDTSGGSGNHKVVLDLGQSSVFDITLDNAVDIFEIKNVPSDGGTFTIKLTQDTTGGRTVDIDTFQTDSPSSIPVYWPGGIVPSMTQTASKTDIYSFKFFNGSAITSAGLYGVVGGQNFS